VPADDRGVEILQQPYAPAAPVGVFGEFEEIDAVRNRQGAGEIGQEDGARLERCDQERLASPVGCRELRPDLGDPAGDLLA